MNGPRPRIDLSRLMGRIEALGRIGALPGGGVCRLALTPADGEGRRLVVDWMKALGLEISVDRIGNVRGVRAGRVDGAPVMIGSHIDTVATGGLYDGNLGVLAGLEVVAALNDAGHVTRRPLTVAFFTNEEGARFAPDMMGSAVHQGALDLDAALATVGIDGKTVADELAAIGFAGDAPPLSLTPHAYLELHIEQGPVLERESFAIGAVTGVQGISWTEVTVSGVSNHAGTTPMAMRCDAGVVAARVITAVREIAERLGGAQVATVGALRLEPGLVNVVPRKAVFTVDLRNTDEARLVEAEQLAAAAITEAARAEGATVTSRRLARFAPVEFDPAIVDLVEATARRHGASVKRMPSGAGHDAQMFAPDCPTGMIFVPSRDGLSHNVREHTDREEIGLGAEILLDVVLHLTDGDE
ncbi:M20 family metallo-hydrolase [Pinisolibacter sp.]|uniref:M20 family metallo-hydrolase n=1 Tax=Pinisolibacter sp. TaxID=2172024 RepID=UPI002FDE46E9